MVAHIFKKLLLLLSLSLVFSCDKKEGTQEALHAIQHLEATDKLPAEQQVAALDSLYKGVTASANDSLNRTLLRKIASRYFSSGHYKKFERASRHYYRLALQQNDTTMMAHGQYLLGDYYFQINKPDSSLYCYLQSEKLYAAAHDTLNAGRAMQCTATILYYNGSYAETEVQAVKALRLFQKANDHELIYDSYMALGLALSDMKNYDKALEYFNLSLEQIQQMEKEGIYEASLIHHFKASSYNNMGIIYEYKKEYNAAIALYNKGLAVTNIRALYPNVYAMLLSNRAYANTLNNNRDAGIKADFFEAKAIRDSLDLKVGIVSSQLHIGKYYLIRRDTAAGLNYIKAALEGAKAIKSETDVTNALSLLAISDPEHNAEYSQEYFRITDSLHQAERATRNKFARIAYETDRIEQQNKVLSRQFKIIACACLAIIILTASLFIIIRLRAKNRELHYAREQQMANEKIYTLLMQQEAEAESARVKERNRLAMELHDGIINRIFTTRFNLSQLETDDEGKKQLLVQELQDTQEEIRKLSHDLKESFLAENESFTAALKNLVDKQQEAAGPVFDLYVDKFINWGCVTPETRVAIFRIIQEASTNAKKHAQAQNCNIALMAQDGTIKLRIWDDGRGFEPKREKHGIGLRNIAERIKALGGTFTLNSAPGEGTVLEILV